MTAPALEHFWSRLADGTLGDPRGLLATDCTWDDPLYDLAVGATVRDVALTRLSHWYRHRRLEHAQPRHFRTTSSAKRVVVEHVLDLRDGLIWNQLAQRSEKAPRFELATAVVADRVPGSDEKYNSVRVYFSTWSVLDGASRVRVGPICPDERTATRAAIDAMPTVRKYFDALAIGDAKIIDLFEPDGYFREPANNYACGRDQLVAHFEHILKLGGVGIEFLTSTVEGARIGLELQTVLWGPKKMQQPQAGFAIYELGPHGLIVGSRVYDSVVPPVL